MVSVTMAPPMQPAKLMPTCVMTGTRLLPTAWCSMAERLEAPFALAVLMKSWRRTSSILVLLMRIMEARVFAPSTSAGRMKCLREPTPVAGSQCSTRQNRI